MKKHPRWAVKSLVPEEVYTDRQKFLEFFYQEALRAITRRARSTVLLGHRRMGKTEIFKRVVNRLFFDQDHTDPQAVVPVFFSFPDEVISRQDFALKYVENFVRWYAAFRLRDPALLDLSAYEDRHPLIDYIQNALPDLSTGFERALHLLKAIEGGGVTLPEERAVQLPRRVSDWDDSTIVMFLDEFQNTHLPEYQFRVVGFMQEAVESPTCPHFVTGSAMSILVQEILGRGALFGRFAHEQITALTDYWGSELALRAARYYQAELPEVMAPVVSERCGGNPFYITAVIQQAVRQRKALCDEETLNEMLAVDLSSGFIWAELHDQVSRWIAKVNEYGITKWALYLAVLEEEDRISLTRIQEELRKRASLEVELHTIKDVLVKLSRGDLLDYKSFGDWFGKIEDPILEEFLKVWGHIEVLGEDKDLVRRNMVKTYQSFQRKFADYRGYLAEVFLIQILWNSQRKRLPGRYFHSAEDIQMPDRFFYIDQRHRLRAGEGLEIDVYAAAGLDIWLAESKWWTGTPVGPNVVTHLVKQGELVREREGEHVRVWLWLFAYDGVTKHAEALLQKHQILWSTRADLDALLEHVNLRKLPVIEGDL